MQTTSDCSPDIKCNNLTHWTPWLEYECPRYKYIQCKCNVSCQADEEFYILIRVAPNCYTKIQSMGIFADYNRDFSWNSS